MSQLGGSASKFKQCNGEWSNHCALGMLVDTFFAMFVLLHWEGEFFVGFRQVSFFLSDVQSFCTNGHLVSNQSNKSCCHRWVFGNGLLRWSATGASTKTWPARLVLAQATMTAAARRGDPMAGLMFKLLVGACLVGKSTRHTR